MARLQAIATAEGAALDGHTCVCVGEHLTNLLSDSEHTQLATESTCISDLSGQIPAYIYQRVSDRGTD